MKSGPINMTEGPLAGKLIRYSLPLMCSNVLQVLFNMADVAVVGRFSGAIALGAVGSTTYLISLSTAILQGLGAGINAVTALNTGLGDKERLQKSVHTSFLICLIAGFLLLFAGVFGAGPILTLMGTKEELISGAKLYLTIYLLGSPALALYNFGNAVLSAEGDTKRPLLYMTTAGVLNIILNLLFVIVFHLDVAGVALASILSQYLSAALLIRHLLVCGKDYALKPSMLRMDGRTAKQVLSIALPSAAQYSLFAVANLFVQSSVNTFDHVVVEGISAAANADNLVYDVMSAFYTACTSFIAQNYGAGKKDRILKIYGLTLLYSAAISAAMGGLLILFRTPFLHLFTTDEAVMEPARVRIMIMAASYWISAFMDDSSAAARGLGKSLMPSIIVILGTVVYRIIWLKTVFVCFHTLPSLFLLFGTAWIFTSIIGNLYLFHTCRNVGILKRSGR